ncbi:MAG: peroxidase-related enzyme [Desulfovibrio sp.]|nr:peroxidase-related enzyme [Desulfovibrio sp.]
MLRDTAATARKASSARAQKVTVTHTAPNDVDHLPAYFRLFSLDPEILEARSNADEGIFHSSGNGLPRAERELAAATTSRVNGCFYCAAIHASFASTFSKRGADVQRLLDEGPKAELGRRWNALVGAAAALAPYLRASVRSMWPACAGRG